MLTLLPIKEYNGAIYKILKNDAAEFIEITEVNKHGY